MSVFHYRLSEKVSILGSELLLGFPCPVEKGNLEILAVDKKLHCEATAFSGYTIIAWKYLSANSADFQFSMLIDWPFSQWPNRPASRNLQGSMRRVRE